MTDKKQQAIHLRKSGNSYNDISRQLQVAKGTLSYWFRQLPESTIVKKELQHKNKLRSAENITRFNKQRAQRAQTQRAAEQVLASREIKKISRHELQLIGTALYWAEGYNRAIWNVIFTNSDPLISKIMLEFFTAVCNVPKHKIKLQIQVHHTRQIIPATTYWTNWLKMPKEQFLKPVVAISRSSSRKMPERLPYGTLRIKIDNVKLVNKIKGWIIGLGQSM